MIWGSLSLSPNFLGSGAGRLTEDMGQLGQKMGPSAHVPTYPSPLGWGGCPHRPGPAGASEVLMVPAACQNHTTSLALAYMSSSIIRSFTLPSAPGPLRFFPQGAPSQPRRRRGPGPGGRGGHHGDQGVGVQAGWTGEASQAEGNV